MRFLLTLMFCSLFVAACGDDDYSKGGLDFTIPETDDGGSDDGGLRDLSMPDLSAVDDTDGGTDSGI